MQDSRGGECLQSTMRCMFKCLGRGRFCGRAEISPGGRMLELIENDPMLYPCNGTGIVDWAWTGMRCCLDGQCCWSWLAYSVSSSVCVVRTYCRGHCPHNRVGTSAPARHSRPSQWVDLSQRSETDDALVCVCVQTTSTWVLRAVNTSACRRSPSPTLAIRTSSARRSPLLK